MYDLFASCLWNSYKAIKRQESSLISCWIKWNRCIYVLLSFRYRYMRESFLKERLKKCNCMISNKIQSLFLKRYYILCINLFGAPSEGRKYYTLYSYKIITFVILLQYIYSIWFKTICWTEQTVGQIIFQPGVVWCKNQMRGQDLWMPWSHSINLMR